MITRIVKPIMSDENSKKDDNNSIKRDESDDEDSKNDDGDDYIKTVIRITAMIKTFDILKKKKSRYVFINSFKSHST